MKQSLHAPNTTSYFETVAKRHAGVVQVQPDQASPYVPRQEGSEGIGSYARKVAQAGLGPMPNPRDVIYNHPVVWQHAYLSSCCAYFLLRLLLLPLGGVSAIML